MLTNGPQRFVDGADELLGLEHIQVRQRLDIRATDKCSLSRTRNHHHAGLWHVPRGFDCLLQLTNGFPVERVRLLRSVDSNRRNSVFTAHEQIREIHFSSFLFSELFYFTACRDKRLLPTVSL